MEWPVPFAGLEGLAQEWARQRVVRGGRQALLVAL